MMEKRRTGVFCDVRPLARARLCAAQRRALLFSRARISGDQSRVVRSNQIGRRSLNKGFYLWRRSIAVVAALLSPSPLSPLPAPPSSSSSFTTTPSSPQAPIPPSPSA